MIGEWVNDIHQGDVFDTLARMPESSVHMAMTSPPYYGLRDYGEDGQIGLEDTLAEYIDRLVDVGDELRRVLRDDGSWWLNLGDSYARDSPAGGRKYQSGFLGGITEDPDGDASSSHTPDDLPRKNKMLVPHRTAIALQEAGWIVRNDAVWAKPNPMPESVTDRLSTTFEFVFHLTPAPDYYYDLDAIREPYSEYSQRMAHRQESGVERGDHTPHGGIGDPENTRADTMNPAGKNPGDVFEVTTKPYPDAHFAVYPPELCEKPIKATAPEQVCAECGAPYEREVSERKERIPSSGKFWDPQAKQYRYAETVRKNNEYRANKAGTDSYDGSNVKEYFTVGRETVGWRSTCDCDTDATEPGIVLDQFAGAGTTCLVAKRLGRRFIGIDLNPEYVAMAQARVGVTVDQPEYLTDDAQATLADGGFTSVADGCDST